MVGGAPGDTQAVFGQIENCTVSFDLRGQIPDGLVTVLTVRDVADERSQETARMFFGDGVIDFRILLSAVADKDHRQIGLELENPSNEAELVSPGTCPRDPIVRKAPAPEVEDPAARDSLQVTELVEEIIEVPWWPRDEDKRIPVAPGRPAGGGV